MSETSTPVGVVFDLQRNAIEQSHEAFKRGVEAQQEFGESFVDFSHAKQANEQGYEAVRTVVDVYFDAVESAAPGQQDLMADFRATVDGNLATLEANQFEAIEALEANIRDGSASAEELLEEFIAVLDEQFEALLEAHEDVEDQTVEAFEGLESNVEELQAELEAQSEETIETFEEQVGEVQEQLETVTEQILTASKSLEVINGVGPTYAGRLQEEGIESLDDLAEASIETVAEIADVTEAKAEEWVDAARSEN